MPRLICINKLEIKEEAFNELINKVPKSEEEAGWIISTVEKMLSENPSLAKHLEFYHEEHKAIVEEMKKLNLI